MRRNLNRFKERFSADEVGGATYLVLTESSLKLMAQAYICFQNAIRLARRMVAGKLLTRCATTFTNIHLKGRMKVINLELLAELNRKYSLNIEPKPLIVKAATHSFL